MSSTEALHVLYMAFEVGEGSQKETFGLVGHRHRDLGRMKRLCQRWLLSGCQGQGDAKWAQPLPPAASTESIAVPKAGVTGPYAVEQGQPYSVELQAS